MVRPLPIAKPAHSAWPCRLAGLVAAGITLLDLLTADPPAFAKSRGEARRLVKQGAVKIDDVRQDDAEGLVTPRDGAVLKVGKRRFARLVSG